MSFWKSAFGALALISAASPALPQDGPLALGRPVSVLVPRGSEKPSFDCAKAKTAAARLICADGELARLDGELGAAFQKRKAQNSASDQSKFVAEQVAWLRERNTRCDLDGKNSAAIEALGSSKPCMVNAIRERIAFLAQTEAEAVPAIAGGQPLQLFPGSRADTEELLHLSGPNAAPPAGTTIFNLGCPRVDSALRSICELAEAVLNRDCASLQSSSAKWLCNSDLSLEAENAPSDPDDTYHPYMLQLGLQASLHHVCDADFIPIVAKECAARRARLEKLTADNRAKVTQLRARAQAAAATVGDAANRILVDCIFKEASTLMVTTETADAVAAAALRFCHEELGLAARAISYSTDLQLWSEGPQPRPKSSDTSAEKHLADTLLSSIAARVMRERAEAARAAPRPGNAPPRPPRDASDTGEIFGTAFFVSTDGQALTNAHVVERCEQVHLYLEGREGTARIVGRDEKNDLALLATDLHPASAANWRLSIKQGEDIVVFGFPLAGVLATGGNVAAGNVTALAGLRNDSRFLQISAPVQPGNSGGPLLDRSGNVVGIVVAKLDALAIASATGDIPQNVNFAIKASVAAAFLDAQGVMHGEGASSPTLSTPDIAERAKGLTMQVVCVR